MPIQAIYQDSQSGWFGFSHTVIDHDTSVNTAPQSTPIYHPFHPFVSRFGYKFCWPIVGASPSPPPQLLRRFAARVSLLEVADVDVRAEHLLQLLLVVVHLSLHHVHAGPEQALERLAVEERQPHGAHGVGRGGARPVRQQSQLAQVAALAHRADLQTRKHAGWDRCAKGVCVHIRNPLHSDRAHPVGHGLDVTSKVKITRFYVNGFRVQMVMTMVMGNDFLKWLDVF